MTRHSERKRRLLQAKPGSENEEKPLESPVPSEAEGRNLAHAPSGDFSTRTSSFGFAQDKLPCSLRSLPRNWQNERSDRREHEIPRFTRDDEPANVSSTEQHPRPVTLSKAKGLCHRQEIPRLAAGRLGFFHLEWRPAPWNTRNDGWGRAEGGVVASQPIVISSSLSRACPEPVPSGVEGRSRRTKPREA